MPHGQAVRKKEMKKQRTPVEEINDHLANIEYLLEQIFTALCDVIEDPHDSGNSFIKTKVKNEDSY